MEGRLYAVGESQFESLVSLINYYTRNPLYRNVKLVNPISKEVLKAMPRHAMESIVRMTKYKKSVLIKYFIFLVSRIE